MNSFLGNTFANFLMELVFFDGLLEKAKLILVKIFPCL
jgi:hypothetical protein